MSPVKLLLAVTGACGLHVLDTAEPISLAATQEGTALGSSFLGTNRARENVRLPKPGRNTFIPSRPAGDLAGLQSVVCHC